MMDTEVLFRDSKRFTSDFNSMPTLITNNSIDSTSSDGAETDTFSPGIYNWDYNSGLADDLGLLLDNLEYGPIQDDIRESVEAWENSVKMENISIPSMVKEEIVTPMNNTHFHLNQIKKEIPDLPEITSVPLSDIYSDLSVNCSLSELPTHLDLCAFINSEELFPQPKIEHTTEPAKQQQQQIPQIKAGRKKIDLKAQRYIIGDDNDEDDENIDVETVSDNGGNSPVLEAKDLKSLLEQFEATEVEVREENNFSSSEPPVVVDNDRNAPLSGSLRSPPNEQKDVVNNVPKVINSNNNTDDDNKVSADVSKSKVSPAKSSDTKTNNKSRTLIINDFGAEIKTTKTKCKVAPSNNNKQIIEALPQELIDRIKESGKRKRIAIIDPVPAVSFKKRKTVDGQSHQLPVAISTSNVITNIQNIVLDHNYCSAAPPQPIKKTIKKDSGYISAEDEDKTLHNQPLVKNADGKLMVSLLKANTIRSKAEENKKKKLNIEEYKKRRMGILSTPTSCSNSPMSSNCSSPLPEDENTRRLKHEEKLRKMALELLNTPPKSSGSGGAVAVVAAPEKKTIENVDKKAIAVPARALAPPPDMDVITYVSIGVNTDVSGGNPLLPVAEKLEEIKPLLKNASVKIDSNSLISSLIENIPRAIKADRTEAEVVRCNHGEDKTVIYLPKDRKPPERREISTQTSITLLGANNKRRYRRRRDSTSSSGSSACSVVRHDNVNRRSQGNKSSRSSRSTSISSASSRSSIRTRSRSLSRSPSPQRRRKKKQRGYDKEYVQEVEERRVVYVGKIASNTTKKELQRRFVKFGPIKSISLHFRDHGDNYGFVTFEHNVDAYEAIEHGNDDPYDPQYDLSFGGRRLFCKTTYSDLDNMRDDHGYGGYHHPPSKPPSAESFDRLLREMQETLKKRKV